MSQVQSVFGQFAVEIDGSVQLFPTENAAVTALAAFTDGAANLADAEAYAASQGLEGKNAKGKVNQVVSYLNWVSAGRPEFVAVEADEAEEVAEEAADDEVQF